MSVPSSPTRTKCAVTSNVSSAALPNTNSWLNVSWTTYLLPLTSATACSPSSLTLRWYSMAPLDDRFSPTRKCMVPVPVNASAVQGFVPSYGMGVVDEKAAAAAPVAPINAPPPSTSAASTKTAGEMCLRGTRRGGPTGPRIRFCIFVSLWPQGGRADPPPFQNTCITPEGLIQIRKKGLLLALGRAALTEASRGRDRSYTCRDGTQAGNGPVRRSGRLHRSCHRHGSRGRAPARADILRPRPALRDHARRDR